MEQNKDEESHVIFVAFFQENVGQGMMRTSWLKMVKLMHQIVWLNLAWHLMDSHVLVLKLPNPPVNLKCVSV